jgi:hypothetical protein
LARGAVCAHKDVANVMTNWAARIFRIGFMICSGYVWIARG